MSQYDLFGDAAQVGGLRCLDAAVGGRAAERLPVEHEVVDAGFQVGAVDRLVLIVGVVEVDARRAFAHDTERFAERRYPRSGGFCHGTCTLGIVVFESREVGESAVAAGREGPGLFENDFAGGLFRPNFVRQCRAVGSY